jgi:3-hydroxyacyl-CoA dehydrogenase
MKPINTVTVVGANGTMGRNIAAIFASFGKATVYLVSRSADKSNRARETAYRSVRAESIKNRMIPADYGQLEECVNASDLIFEACAENWAVKESVHQMISDALRNLPVENAANKVICSGTSGLSITSLAELYQEPYRMHVIGMHLFNPPYQMTLCELTPTVYTDRDFFDSVRNYTEKVLLRTTVEVKDSPAFLAKV